MLFLYVYYVFIRIVVKPRGLARGCQRNETMLSKGELE